MKGLTLIENTIKQAKTVVVTALFFIFSINTVLAKLPALEEPSKGPQKGIMATIQAYGYDAFVLGGLFGVAVCILIALKNCVSEYSAIGEGRGSWAKFSAFVVVGVILIVVCIYFAGLAADTFS